MGRKEVKIKGPEYLYIFADRGLNRVFLKKFLTTCRGLGGNVFIYSLHPRNSQETSPELNRYLNSLSKGEATVRLCTSYENGEQYLRTLYVLDEKAISCITSKGSLLVNHHIVCVDLCIYQDVAEWPLAYTICHDAYACVRATPKAKTVLASRNFVCATEYQYPWERKDYKYRIG